MGKTVKGQTDHDHDRRREIADFRVRTGRTSEKKGVEVVDNDEERTMKENCAKICNCDVDM